MRLARKIDVVDEAALAAQQPRILQAGDPLADAELCRHATRPHSAGGRSWLIELGCATPRRALGSACPLPARTYGRPVRLSTQRNRRLSAASSCGGTMKPS